MNKKIKQTLAGALSLMFVGQVMIYGDGAAQGILHADTIASAAEAIEGMKNADQLAKEFEEATEGLGKVQFFDVPESNDANIMAFSDESEEDAAPESEVEEDFSLDYSLMALEEAGDDFDSGSLTISGKVQKGVVSGHKASDNTPIFVRIYDGDWNEIESWEVSEGEEYTATVNGSGVHHVKFECDGYLPFYLKDFGTGAFQVGSGESKDTITLVPGDSTYNADNDNQWSDDVINSSDAAYVQSCFGATRGDSDFNPTMDADGDGTISQTDLDDFCEFYEELRENDEEITLSDFTQSLDINLDGVINNTDYSILSEIVESASNPDGYSLPDLADGNGVFDANDLAVFKLYLDDAREYRSEVYIYNHEMTGDVIVNADDFNDGINKINEDAQKRSRSDNYYEYMDKDNNGTIENSDIAWFTDAYPESGDLDWDHAFKRSLTLLDNGYFPYSFNLHDTNLDLNGCGLKVNDCMSFTTDIPEFWSGGQGATLDINGGALLIENNLVFRTASPDGWNGTTGQTMNLNGGTVIIGNCFDFGQANCYDTIQMTNDADILAVGGNWTYITLTDMEGKWTAGNIWFLGPTWEVNEASGDKSIYSSGSQIIHFGYAGGKQTILWDNCETYINNEDGSLNTERTFNFGYEYGIDFLYDFTAENYWFRPWFRPYDIPDYTLYRKGWEIGDGVHIATGNYTKSFTDLSITSPGVKSDFVRTYNSMSDEEGSFGIGWDFNIDVSKIVIPAEGYYQVVLPDGSNTTFKDDGNGGFECLNAHSTMAKSSDEYTITNAAQSQYHFNADGELDWVKDAEGNKLTISAMSNNQRIVTDSTGRTYTITYNGNMEHSRITKIEDTAAERIVTYEYNGDFQLVSATSVSGGTEYYEYDGNGRLCKITNCYDEVTDQIVYNDNGSVNWLTNASGLKQVYTYDKAFKQTGLKEYDGDTLVKTYTYDYDEKYAVNTNTVETDGQTYEVDKITYSTDENDENKYDEMIESVDIMGNTTKYDRDGNGNVIKTTNADGTYTLANYNDKNSILASVDEMGYATIYSYDSNGTRLLKQASSLNPLSQSDINTVTASGFDPVTYLAANESSYAITSHEYYADSYVSGVAGLIRATTDPEGNVTEYDYYKDGYGKGLVKSKTLKDGSTVVNTVTYEYNAQLQVSKETTGYDLTNNLYAVKEYEYDSFNNVTVTRDYGTGSTAAVTISEYDLLSRKTAEYTPNYSADKSHGTLTTYYPDGNVKTVTDAEGNTTSYEYDAYGQVTKKTNPDGTMNLTSYDGLQREKATYFQSGESGIKQILTSTSYEFAGYNFDIYTALDSCSSHSCKGLKTTKTTYITEDKQVISETLTDIKEHTIYEKTNGETKRISAYYANGQLARQTDALGNTTKYEYGYLNKITKTYTPFNIESDGSVNYSVTENQYDKNGNVILTKQTVQKQDSDTAKYSVTQNQYNAQGLLTQVTLSDGTSNGEKNITKYFYNNAGIQTKMYTGLSSASDSDYMTTNYEYDAWGHLVRTTDSTGYNSGTTTYDLNGNVLTVTDANGNVTTNTYDALNRVLTANTVCSDTSKNVSKSYTYNNMGRVTKKVSNGVETSYEYDLLGRIYREWGPNFKGYFYEGVSSYVEEQLVGKAHLLLYSITNYEYDGEMRVIQVKESGNLTASYTYDANGNKASETLANGVVSTYTYNGCNKVTNLVTKSGDSTISSYEYSYYLDGSDACKVRNESGIIETTDYEYDGLKRLTEEAVTTNNSTDTYAYEYDDYGNRVQMTATGSEEYTTVYDYSDADGNYTALLQEETKTVEDDSNAATENGLASSPFDLANAASANSSVETTTYTYDVNGNQITKTADGKTETNTYDGLNQLIGFTDGETTASYTYDVDGLRLSKTVNGKTTEHVWDGNQQIVADVKTGLYYDADCYLRGTNLVATYSFENGARTEYTYYTQNAHGDVVNLTDESGAVIKSYTYDAFGVEKNIDNSDTNAFRYCGEYFDAETGTIYLRARYYNPSMGRFISRDSFAGKISDPLSLNLYTYCYNNPLIYMDPSGHGPIKNFFKKVKEKVLNILGFKKTSQDAMVTSQSENSKNTTTGTTSQVTTSQVTTSTRTTTTTEQKNNHIALTPEQQETQLIVAMTIYGEEHGRTTYNDWQKGQQAIAAIIANRNKAEISYLGTTLDEICTNGQFDGYFSGRDAYNNNECDITAWNYAYQLAEYVVIGDYESINVPAGITEDHLYFNATGTYDKNITLNNGKFSFGSGTEPVTTKGVVTYGGNTFFYY